MCGAYRQVVGGSTGLDKPCRRLFAGLNSILGIGFMLQMASIWKDRVTFEYGLGSHDKLAHVEEYETPT